MKMQEKATPAKTTETTKEAGTGGGEQQKPADGMMQFMIPLLLMGAVFYFLLIRPQKKQQLEREKLISGIKKNDHVFTTGGIFGIVDKVKDNEMILKIDEKSDVRIRVARSAIAGVEKVSGAEGESKPETPEEAKK